MPIWGKDQAFKVKLLRKTQIQQVYLPNFRLKKISSLHFKPHLSKHQDQTVYKAGQKYYCQGVKPTTYKAPPTGWLQYWPLAVATFMVKDGTFGKLEKSWCISHYFCQTHNLSCNFIVILSMSKFSTNLVIWCKSIWFMVLWNVLDLISSKKKEMWTEMRHYLVKHFFCS